MIKSLDLLELYKLNWKGMISKDKMINLKLMDFRIIQAELKRHDL